MYQHVLNAVHAIPGVTGVTSIENVLVGGLTSNNNVDVNGQKKSIYMNAVGPGFVETVGMRLLAGRTPGLQDVAGAPAVGALNETGARFLFGDAPPIGQVVALGNRKVQIVGIVSDSLYDGQRAGVRPTIFDSAMQRQAFSTHVMVRSVLPLEQLTADLKRAVSSVSLALPAPEVRSQVAQIEDRIGRERVFARLLTIFGAFALLLASIGLHGVTAYSVSRRTNEIGVRMALGARPADVMRMVVVDGLRLTGIGVVVGLAGAVAATRLTAAYLLGADAIDLPAFVAVTMVLVAVSCVASYLPARRAASTDPLNTLRAE